MRKRDSVTVLDSSGGVFARPAPATAISSGGAPGRGGGGTDRDNKAKSRGRKLSTTRWLQTIKGGARAREKKRLGRLSTEIGAGSQGKAPPGFKRIQSHKSGPLDFEHVRFAQELDSQHLGPIWCIRFSRCGQLLATAGQDTTLSIWVVKDAYKQFKGGPNSFLPLSERFIHIDFVFAHRHAFPIQSEQSAAPSRVVLFLSGRGADLGSGLLSWRRRRGRARRDRLSRGVLRPAGYGCRRDLRRSQRGT